MPNEADSLLIDDFTPGIHHHRYGQVIGQTGLGQPGPLGSASLVNTYRCCANPDGSLGPLPKRQPAAQTAPPRGTVSSPSHYPSGQARLVTSDALVDSQIFRIESEVLSLTQNDFSTTDQVNVFIASIFYYNSAGGGGGGTYTSHVVVTAYRPPLGTVSDIWFNRSGLLSPATWLPTARLTRATTVDNTVTTLPYSPSQLKNCIVYSYGGPTNFGVTSGGAAIAAPELALLRDTLVTTYQSPYFWMSAGHWPSVNAPAGDTAGSQNNLTHPAMASIGGGGAIKHLITHQGSVVPIVHGLSGIGFGSREQHRRESVLWWSPYNLFNTPNPGYVIPGEELTSGYGAAASMNANELVLIRHRGGAVVIRGDLGFPNVVALPMVRGTYGVECVPVVTPIGLVYLSANGVMAWNGQDSSVDLSPQIDGDFTAFTEPIPRYGSRGRLGYWEPWVLCPNNFMFDTRTNGWWRLEDSTGSSISPYNCFDVDHNNRMFAFKAWTDLVDQVPWDHYLHTSLASNYSWQSTPIVSESSDKDRWDTYNGVTLVSECNASGATPTVTVSVTGYNEEGAATTTGTAVFNLTQSAFPATKKVTLDRPVRARAIVVRIVADGDANPAPLVRALKLHRRPGHSVVRDT